MAKKEYVWFFYKIINHNEFSNTKSRLHSLCTLVGEKYKGVECSLMQFPSLSELAYGISSPNKESLEEVINFSLSNSELSNSYLCSSSNYKSVNHSLKKLDKRLKYSLGNLLVGGRKIVDSK